MCAPPPLKEGESPGLGQQWVLGGSPSAVPLKSGGPGPPHAHFRGWQRLRGSLLSSAGGKGTWGPPFTPNHGVGASHCGAGIEDMRWGPKATAPPTSASGESQE